MGGNCHSRQFLELMALYEQNYYRLRQLLPEKDEVLEDRVSRVPGHMDLHLWMLERTKFTTALRLSYVFEYGSKSGGGVDCRPDLTVRIYHDAQMAEVLSASLHRALRRRAGTSVLAWRWSLNHFLGRWLAYCQRQGHSFRLRATTDEMLATLMRET